MPPRTSPAPIPAEIIAPPPAVRLSTSLIAVLITVILQAVVLVTWAAKMDSRVAAIETAIGPITDGTVARLDERTRGIEKGVERIERALEDRR